MNELNNIEKRYAAAMLGDMKALDFNNPELWPLIRESMKRVAYHEAGHFTARLFTQLELSHTTEISILGNSENAGYVRSERNFTESNLESYPPPLIRSNGYMLLIKNIAGYGAEALLDKSEEWENVFDYYEYNYCGDDYDTEGTDFYKALRIAGIMSKPFMPVNRIINLANKWTLEMLKIPIVWNKVEVVAAKLIKQGEIKKEELDDLLFDEKFPDCYHLPKWRRRIFPKPGELDQYIEKEAEEQE